MKYLSKDALLVLLNDEANAFVQFFMTPGAWGVTEPLLSQLKVVKQKLDWVGGFNIDLPEVQQMLALLTSYGVITQIHVDAINNIADNPNMDSYAIYILAQSDITIENQLGAQYGNNGWKITVTFKNVTKNTFITEDFIFDSIPDNNAVNQVIADHVKRLKGVTV